MRKSGKLLLGVLSVAALIGTGMGAFVINGTYGSVTDTFGVTTTEEYYSRGFNITAEKADNDGINFDGTGGDLKVKYTVKATAIDGGFTQDALYNPDTWKAVAKEHRPNLKISATHTNVDKTREDLFNKYVVLPDVATISYETWLAANLKETGYTYEFEVEWNKEELGGYSTPNEYFATVDNATGIKVYNEIKSGLEYADITVKFEAGYYEGGSTVDPTPSVDTTGTVTLPDTATSNALLAITGTQENGTIEAGEQTLSLTLEDGYELDTDGLKVSVDGRPAVPVSVSEVPSDVMSLKNPGKKYTGKYTFVKGSTYAFSVSVKEIQAEPPVEETKYANVSLGPTENGTINYQAGQVEVNSTVTFKVTPDQYYKVDTVSYTLDGGDPQVLVADDNGDYSFLAAKENGEYVINATFVLDEDNLEYTKISSINEQLAEVGDTASLDGTFTIRGYVTGMTDLTTYGNHSSVFIADGNSSIALYRPTPEILGEAKIGSLVEVTGTAGKSYKTVRFNATKVTVLESDKTVETPVVYDLNDSTVGAFAFDLTNGQSRKVSIKGAAVKSVNDRYFDITVGQTDFTIYLTQNDNLVAWDEIQVLNPGVTFDCTAFVGQYNGEAQFVGISDFVAHYDEAKEVAVSNGDTVKLEVGNSVALNGSVLPTTAKQILTYTDISNNGVISVSNNVVQGLTTGVATVRVAYSESIYKDVTIDVSEPSVAYETYTIDCAAVTRESSSNGTNITYSAFKGLPFTLGQFRKSGNSTNTRKEAEDKELRVYQYFVLSLTRNAGDSSALIHKVDFTFSDESSDKYYVALTPCDDSGNSVTTITYAVGTGDHIDTASSKDGVDSMYFLASKQSRLLQIKIYYTK